MPLYKIDPCKIKLAFNNARSLHKHFKDIQWERNVLAADVIGFAESRLCTMFILPSINSDLLD